MSAQPSPHDSHDVIRLGGETAVVVPVHEYHTLKALRDRASAEQVEEAEIDAAIAEHEAWKAAGRPGLKSHDEFISLAGFYVAIGTSGNQFKNAPVAGRFMRPWYTLARTDTITTRIRFFLADPLPRTK
jgi:glycine/D-amino acid oxidase-like deaminating enzyme